MKKGSSSNVNATVNAVSELFVKMDFCACEKQNILEKIKIIMCFITVIYTIYLRVIVPRYSFFSYFSGFMRITFQMYSDPSATN